MFTTMLGYSDWNSSRISYEEPIWQMSGHVASSSELKRYPPCNKSGLDCVSDPQHAIDQVPS
jgi:hypothetical protein